MAPLWLNIGFCLFPWLERKIILRLIHPQTQQPHSLSASAVACTVYKFLIYSAWTSVRYCYPHNKHPHFLDGNLEETKDHVNCPGSYNQPKPACHLGHQTCSLFREMFWSPSNKCISLSPQNCIKGWFWSVCLGRGLGPSIWETLLGDA